MKRLLRVLLRVIEAYVRLIAHDAFMAGHDLAALLREIRNSKRHGPIRNAASAEAISHALDIACAFYPMRVLCLKRSAVLVKMLRKRGFPAQLVIGAQKMPFKAHAWVEVEGTIINDRQASRENFLVLEVC